MCKFCEEKFPVITHYGKFKIDKLSNKPVITCNLNKCPSFAVCSSKDMNVEMVMKIAYCPICGRKLVKDD
nr:MAG TPA: zinc ribbon protein [Caudoviricetes sp.]